MDLSKNETNHKDLDGNKSSIKKCQKTDPTQLDMNKFRCIGVIATKDLIHKYFPKKINTSMNDSVYNQTCTGFLLFMHRLWLEQTMCDMVIHADGGSIMTHQIVIATYSPALSYIFAQNSIKKMANVTLCDVPVEVLADVLNCLYTTDLKLNENNIERVILCAKQLDLPVFLKLCKDFLKNYSTTKNIIFYYCLAINYKFHEEKCALLKTIVKNFGEYKNQTHLYLLPYERFLAILQHPSLDASSEDLLESIVNWVNFDQDDRIYYLKNLFDLINLENIEASSLSNVLDENNWILDDNHCRDMVLKAYKYHAMCEPQTIKKIHIDKTSKKSIERNTTANNQTSKDSSNEESLTKTMLYTPTVDTKAILTKDPNEYYDKPNTPNSQSIKNLLSSSKSSDKIENNLTENNKTANSKEKVHFSNEDVKYIYPEVEDEGSRHSNEEHSTHSVIESKKVLNENLAILKEKFDIATKFSKNTDENEKNKYFSLKNSIITKEKINNQMRFKILPGDTREKAGWRIRRDNQDEDGFRFKRLKTESSIFKADRRTFKSTLEENLSKLKESLEKSQYCKIAKEMQKYEKSVNFKILPSRGEEDKMVFYKTSNLKDLFYAQAKMKTFNKVEAVKDNIFAKNKTDIREASKASKPQEIKKNSLSNDNVTCPNYNDNQTKSNNELPNELSPQINFNSFQTSSIFNNHCLNGSKIDPLVNTVDGSVERDKTTKHNGQSENKKYTSNIKNVTGSYGVFNQPLCEKSIKQDFQLPSPTNHSNVTGFVLSKTHERIEATNNIVSEKQKLDSDQYLVHPSDVSVGDEALLEMDGHVFSNFDKMLEKQPQTIGSERNSLENRLYYEKMINLLKNDMLSKKNSNFEPITLRNMYGSLEKVINHRDLTKSSLREVSFEDNKLESYDRIKNIDESSTSFFSSTDGTPGSSVISMIQGSRALK